MKLKVLNYLDLAYTSITGMQLQQVFVALEANPDISNFTLNVSVGS